MAKILVVDDISIMRQVIKGHLERLEHTVVAEAGDGDKAVQQYKLFRPDVVTMDITMPAENGIKNGIDSLKLIREFDKDAKVIMITSHGEEKLVMEALMAGAKGYILKPVTEEKIQIALMKVVEQIKINTEGKDQEII